MRGINCKALWIKALYKCSPLTILAMAAIMPQLRKPSR
uniref:Uncharacterized protein n=1 Tax=Anguilla anguilla TaxID=7936 RepID=A0A0E9VAC4_ANGAN